MTDLSPIQKRLALKAPTETAFRHFTENIRLWWPMKTHSISEARTADVVFESKPGGRVYEVDADGRERDWGVVLVYDPYKQLIFSWVLEKPDRATEVEVNFTPTGADSCELDLVHRGWDTRPEGDKWRGPYSEGWALILDQYETTLAA
ncbi:MAG: SRPBCC domain-containing protein [Pseudomonadota bacterium]